MGNILRRRKKVVTEELETLSQQMKVFRDDIEKTAEAFDNDELSKTLAIKCIHQQPVYTEDIKFEVFGALKVECHLYHANEIRHLVEETAFSTDEMRSKVVRGRGQKDSEGLDGLVARKRSLLETVKETETFKVAKEILEKYDQESPKSLSQPPSPSTDKRSTANRRGPAVPAGQLDTTVPQVNNVLPGANGPNRPPVKALYTKSFESIPAGEAVPVRPIAARSRLKPIRPYQRESTTIVDKMVDYFFGDGPSQRFALICSSCHGHNGMAVPAEYDYLAFVCFICGHFNPAKKFRPSHLSSTPVPSTPKVSKPSAASDIHPITSNSLPEQTDEQEKLSDKEHKDDSFDDLSGDEASYETTSH